MVKANNAAVVEVLTGEVEVKPTKVNGKPKKKAKKVKPAETKVTGTLAYKPRTVGTGKRAVPVEAAAASNGTGRATVFGHSVSAVQRWCGSQGWNFAEVRGLLETLGLGKRITEGNTRCQVSSGRRLFNETGESHFGPPAELTKEQAASLNALRPKEAKE